MEFLQHKRSCSPKVNLKIFPTKMVWETFGKLLKNWGNLWVYGHPKYLIKLARLAGFEPATHGLEVRCSVLLSYRRFGFGGWAVERAIFRGTSTQIFSPH